MQVPPYVKTSLAPGSKVVTEYLQAAGLLEPLAGLHFDLVGYGCTTCIGNSGPLPAEVANAVTEGQLVAAAVLSGNRNFEGRVHPHVRANYLASPPLVVAYALAGTVDIDLATEPLGNDRQGKPVYLREIWPSQAEVSRRAGQIRAPGNVPQELRQHLGRQRDLERHSRGGRRSVRVEGCLDLHSGAAVLHRPQARAWRDW